MLGFEHRSLASYKFFCISSQKVHFIWSNRAKCLYGDRRYINQKTLL